MNVDKLLLTPTEIGDHLNLEDEAAYPCSDGSSMITFSVDALLKAQVSKVLSDLKSQIEQMEIPYPEKTILPIAKGTATFVERDHIVYKQAIQDVLRKLKVEEN